MITLNILNTMCECECVSQYWLFHFILFYFKFCFIFLTVERASALRNQIDNQEREIYYNGTTTYIIIGSQTNFILFWLYFSVSYFLCLFSFFLIHEIHFLRVLTMTFCDWIASTCYKTLAIFHVDAKQNWQ